MRTDLPLRSEAIRSPRGCRLSLKRHRGRAPLLATPSILVRPSGFRITSRADRICMSPATRHSAPSMHPSEFRVPVDACDCHMHVYEDRFPLVPQATFKPPPAPLTD